ncbi:MAG: DUF115 domain-containing protein [Planctomycetota bacterium]|nr:DUF115 domain-containing protein [Planctomycetota bacterium]
MIVPWIWADPALEERYWDELPEPEPAPALNREQLVELLQRPANDRIETVAVVGYAPQALALMVADPRWRSKIVVWFVRPGHLQTLAEEARDCDCPRLWLRVAVYEQASDFLVHVQRLPLLAWTLVMLDQDPKLLSDIQYLRSQRLLGAYLPAERTLVDLAHLLASSERCARGIPLPWWKGRYAGASALCIAAGPSLDRHLDFVRRHAADCVVIAVDIVHRRLRAAGIAVDFVVNVDSHELVCERVGDDPDPRTCLVMPLDGHRQLDRPFALVSFVADPALGEPLLGPGSHTYIHGTNVGSCSVGLAFHLGCREALLVGHDLSFTAERFYSGLVSDPEAIKSFNLQAIGSGLMTVPGNDGTTVQTSWDFRAGIRDLAVMSEYFAAQGMRVINLNIGHGIGALIPNTAPLPEGWRPAPRPPVDPQSAPRCTPSLDVARLRELLPQRIAAFRARWRELEAAHDGDALEAFLLICDEAEQQLALRFLMPFVMPFVYQLYRLHAQSQLPGWRAAAVATARVLQAAMDEAERRIEEVLREGAHRAQAAAGHWRPEQEPFFHELRQAVPVLPPASLDEVVVPLIARDWRGLCPLLPQLRWTGFASVVDAVQIVAALASWAPPETVAEMLAWCRLTTGVAHVPELAQRHGIAEDPAVQAAPASAALAALERLGRGELRGEALREAAVQALAWTGAQPFLVERLLAPGVVDGGGAELLGELVRQGRLILDDALAALIIERHPDPVAACDLLEPLSGVRGERCAVAAAERLAQIGAHRAALEMLSALRPLSAVAVPAAARRIASLIQLELWSAVDAELARLPSPGLRCLALYRVLAGWCAPWQALCKLREYPQLRPVPAALLSEVLLDAIHKRQIPVELRDALAELLAQSRAAGINPSEAQAYDDLAQALQRLTAMASR